MAGYGCFQSPVRAFGSSELVLFLITGHLIFVEIVAFWSDGLGFVARLIHLYRLGRLVGRPECVVPDQSSVF